MIITVVKNDGNNDFSIMVEGGGQDRSGDYSYNRIPIKQNITFNEVCEIVSKYYVDSGDVIVRLDIPFFSTL